MATLGNPLVSFSQSAILGPTDPGVCCRLGYKWLASKVAPGTVPAFKFGGVNLQKTLEKQNAYLKDADPYEKESPGAFRLGVSAVSAKWLNLWGEKHGIKFETVLGVSSCTEYFAKGYGNRSAIFGEFGKLADGSNWAHATAYFAGGPLFFDANQGEFALGMPNPGAALDNYHKYLAGPGETLDRYVFWAI
ncbi:MAG TPA: hypothetical protein VHZ52_16770 [Acidobacteriaceae bacterium]|jgi:hypothetical protein|nr:hypothetical protein [Acidobacteriaceae bacterium]